MYSVSGTAYIDIADKGKLLPVERYSDLNDREYFVGSGETVQLHEGGILLIDMSEAFKILQQSYGVLMQAQVTVEGFSFPNK
ncbi:beta-galactosidase beta subunit [Gardnerella vaginalis ATCC 14018 = JCM 11026]|nr:beta-galactosidase beta subunit [Gardnerella vaginalis ATCC 14018 = JCM 11026]